MKTNMIEILLPYGMSPTDARFELHETEISIKIPRPPVDQFIFVTKVANDSKAKESQPEELPDTGLAISGGSTHDSGYDRVQLWLSIYREKYINGNNQVGRRNKDAEEAANLAVEAFDRKFS